MKGYILIWLSVLVLNSLLAQDQKDTIHVLSNKRSLIIETEVETGGILASGDLKEQTFKDAFYNGINLRVGWKIQQSTDQYFKLYHNPTYGIGVYTSTFNKSAIGSPNALYGFVQSPFGNVDNPKWAFDYRIGLGLSGNSRPYHEDKNPINLAIGTKNNVFIDFGIRAQRKISDHIHAGLGIAFHHFSNGALKLPNKGINLVPITASLTYQPVTYKQEKDTATLEPYPTKLFYHISTGVGWKQVERDWDKRFLKATWSMYVSRHVSYKWRIGGGIDMFYSDSGNSEEIADDKTGKLSAKLSGGPAFYLVHILNRNLLLNGNVGYYIHNQEFNGEVKKIFLRAGVRHYIYEGLNAGVSIKAHMGKADFIEWTLGYTFNR